MLLLRSKVEEKRYIDLDEGNGSKWYRQLKRIGRILGLYNAFLSYSLIPLWKNAH